ncbi:MAG TPA: glycine radical domain-containing protein, partial [Candidatus Hydrogenedentes bacterium]|nr:glycine radical domain-containing protein [Candidatus Hydrogenedentota bacterium]
ELVYGQGAVTLPEFVQIPRDDWQGHENLRRMVQTRFACYGNDDDGADGMVRRVFDDYTRLAAQTREREGVLRPAGISTFGREIEWAAPNGKRRASPDGHRLGAVLATNFSPSPGTDAKGPTAVLRSYCKMDFTKCPNCATVELKVHPDTVRGEDGVTALAGLMRGFVELGGLFLHIDVVDSAMLLDAQRHPEKYPNLAVRIAGWSARFATLNKNWQDMVIARTQQYA